MNQDGYEMEFVTTNEQVQETAQCNPDINECSPSISYNYTYNN